MTQSNSPPTATQRWDDISILLAPFRERVVALIGRMTALGFSPVLWETYRSPERAMMLVRRGTSRAHGGQSMHCYGLAADIVCREHHWDCAEHGCKFYENLGEQSQKCGLTWGGDWDHDPSTREHLFDAPHSQGVTLDKQDAIRHATSNEEREAICIACLGPVVP